MATKFPLALYAGDTLNVTIHPKLPPSHPLWGSRPVTSDKVSVYIYQSMTIHNEGELSEFAYTQYFPLHVEPNMEVRLPGLPAFVIGQKATFETIYEVIGFMLLAEGIPEIGMYLPGWRTND